MLLLYDVQVLQYALIDGSCSQAAAYEKYGFFVGLEAELFSCLFRSDGGIHHVVSYGVPCQDDFLCGEEAFHSLIGHTDFLHLLRQELVGHPGIGVLLLYQAGNAHGGTLVESGATGVASHAYGGHGAELAYDTLGHSLALPYLEKHGNILEQVFPVESADRQSHDFVTGVGHALHFHSALGSYKEYFGCGLQLFYGIGNRNGREDVSSRAATADDNSQWIVHVCN